MAAFIVPAIASLLGGVLSHKGKNKETQAQNENILASQRAQQQQRYNYGRGTFEHNAAAQAARGQIAQQLMAQWFSPTGYHPLTGLSLSPGVASTLSTPTAYPAFEFAPGPTQVPQSGMSALGAGLSGIAGPLAMGMSTNWGRGDISPLAGSPNAGNTPFDQYMNRYATSWNQGQGGVGPPPPDGVPVRALTGG